MKRPVVQTRAIVTIVAILIAFTSILGPPPEVTPFFIGYLVLTVAAAAILGDRITSKFWRAMPEILDVVLISVVVGKTGRLESPWFLLYVFPVMSVARFLGRRGSLGMAVIAVLTYGAVVAGRYSPATITVFGIRVLIMVGVALTAASLSRQRDEDASLLKAIEKIDREILNNADIPQLTRSILQSAIEVTDSEIATLILIEDGNISEVHADALADVSDEDQWAARDVMSKHAQLLATNADRKRWLKLPAQRFAPARLFRNVNPAYWTARLVLLTVDDRAVGILGVFSRRFVHYTENDVIRLASMAPLVELTRKHAKVFADLKAREHESKERLQLLYEIGEHLATERGLGTLFKNVVRLASDRLRTEEAALFTPDEGGERIVKRAAWGPDGETRKKLEKLETSYRRGENSLTRRVFDGTDLDPSNVIAEGEVHASEYRRVLPSGQTRDYLGAQLRIGSEVLGVIRVLNKKARDYTVRTPLLDDQGFDREDKNLLEMIATQVAAAIRSASFIEKQRYFQDIIYKSPDPIMVLDERGRIRNFNRQAEKYWNRSEEQVRNESVVNFYSSEAEARRVGKALWEAEDHTISDFMTEIRIVDEVLPVRLSASLLVENGILMGSIGVFKEQTERIRRAEEEQLNALAKMAQSLGHTVKNDLAAMDNRLDSIREAAQGNPLILKYYSAMRALTTSIRSKLAIMLATTKPEPLPRKTLLSVTGLLRDFEGSVAQETADASIAFSALLPAADGFVLGDSARLHEVLVNLFVNSVEAIKTARKTQRTEAGEIRVAVTVDARNSKVLIEWRDDGSGMSADTVRKAFAPYYTTKDTGTGLGLFHSRRTVENHGGTITVRSTEGAGTLFRITLPLAQETTEQRTA